MTIHLILIALWPAGLRQIKASQPGTRDKPNVERRRRQMSHRTETLRPPAAGAPAFIRRLYRSARRLFRSVIARIDLSQFPGSCCG
jgi:hypothetical protein